MQKQISLLLQRVLDCIFYSTECIGMHRTSRRRHSKDELSKKKCTGHSREPTDQSEEEAFVKAHEQKVPLSIT